MFLTGKAGTGKTTFLKEIVRQTSKRFAVVAPTGVAAINAGEAKCGFFGKIVIAPDAQRTEAFQAQHTAFGHGQGQHKTSSGNLRR